MSEKRTFRLDKLVRDKIVEGHGKIGGSADYEVLEAERLRDALIDKLHEELSELKYGQDIDLTELADIREIIDAIALASGHRKVDLEAEQYDKRKRVGGFTAGHFVKTVTVPANSELAEYYASDTERFPEVK